MNIPVEPRPPVPPFTLETAVLKVRKAEDTWNTRDPQKVALAYTTDSRWRNRSEFLQGRPAIIEFLARKWAKEADYRLIKELWAFSGDKIAVRFAYEWRDATGAWFRAYGNENWLFDTNGLIERGTPASTIWQSEKMSANSYGISPGLVPPIIPDQAVWTLRRLMSTISPLAFAPRLKRNRLGPLRVERFPPRARPPRGEGESKCNGAASRLWGRRES